MESGVNTENKVNEVSTADTVNTEKNWKQRLKKNLVLKIVIILLTVMVVLDTVRIAQLTNQCNEMQVTLYGLGFEVVDHKEKLDEIDREFNRLEEWKTTSDGAMLEIARFIGLY